ncbi:MAG: phosphoribosylanthranilate isomerase [Ardenticatenia bacterium]|nr:MAG: phosphoribosylanthranilate isomerase [Ardenticatenia bacterium]
MHVPTKRAERTFIKICGLTNEDDALAAAEAGADFLGFVFYPKSPRYVTPETVARIVETVRATYGADAPRFVGVFVDETPERVRAILDTAGLDLAQLHGSEPPAEVRMLAPRAFKAIRPQTRGDAEATTAAYAHVIPREAHLPQFLMDAYHPWEVGGTGIVADWAVGLVLARSYRLLLAGGLTPETVGAAIARVQPWGVDVSSGVEREKGRKDHARLRAFVEAVRTANVALAEQQTDQE